MPEVPRGRARLRWTLLLIGASLLPFANGLANDFTYDDKAIVRDNPRIRSPRAFQQILTTNYFGRPKGSGTNYRPVLLASFAGQWWLHGNRPWAFRLVNVLLHAAVTLLLVGLFRSAGFPEPQSVGAGLLFAVHPIHVESVTSLVGRGETLAALFVLAYARLAVPVQENPRFPIARHLAAFGCLFLGVLTKESAAVGPLLALLLLYRRAEGGFLRRLGTTRRRGAVVLGGSAVVLAGVFLLRAQVLGSYLKGNKTKIFELENPLAPLGHLDRAITASALVFRYLGRAVFPGLLTADESAWSLPLLSGRSPASFLWPALLLTLIALSLAAIRISPSIAFGFLFFVASFAITSNLLFPIGTVFAERLAYLPSAGVCLMLVSLLFGSGADWRAVSRRGPALLVALAVLFAARTIVRNDAWTDDFHLFSNTVATSPESGKGHYNLAYVLSLNGDAPGALREYERAVRIYPRYFDAWAGKGRVEKELGQLDRAEASYRRGLQAQPGHESGYFGLGAVREARGDWSGAEAAYREGVRFAPRSLPLHYRLALVRTRIAPESAGEDWRRVLALKPGGAGVRLDYARWLMGRGARGEASREARAVLRAHPGWTPAYDFLAELKKAQGLRFAEGIARERVFGATRCREDLARLLEVTRVSPAYRARYESVRPRLQRLAPWAFRAANDGG